MNKIRCIYCGESHDKMKDTAVLKEKEYEEDS